MELAEVQAWFAAHGLPFSWRRDLDGNGQPADAILRPPEGEMIPLDPLAVAIVVPDIHLAGGNDIFRYLAPAEHEARLERFLRALHALRDELTDQFQSFACVQLGDFYDLMRVPGVNPNDKRAAVDAAYPTITDLARRLPLLHCIGNHDKDFWRSPPSDAVAKYALARVVGGPDILCFHGHDKVTLFNVVVHNLPETLALTVLNAINTLPVLGWLTSWLQSLGDDSLADDAIGTTHSLPWGRGVPGPDGWSAPWVARNDAVALGTVIRGFEKGLNHVVRVAFIGHSHRPGISWAPVTQLREVALIDVGSWTYGRAEFAVVASDGIGLAYL
jgi:hypothetical protein